MTPTPAPQPDPLLGYVANDRDAVRAAAPPEPTAAQWDAVHARVRARLAPASPAPARARNRWQLVAAGLALAASVAGAWFALRPAPVQQPGVAEVKPEAPPAPGAPEVPDPLAGFAVLPMAAADEVDVRRVPGTGWLPLAPDPLAGGLALAAREDVELDDPDPAWAEVVPAPGDVPMIFAAKPR